MFGMNSTQISETFQKGQYDGRELYEVVSMIKKVGIALVAGLGLLCLILSFAMLGQVGTGAFVLSFTISAIVLLILYAVVIIGTNSAQVLVHLLNSNLALLSIALDKQENSPSENNRDKADKEKKNQSNHEFLKDIKNLVLTEQPRSSGNFEFHHARSEAQLKISQNGFGILAEGEFPSMTWKIYKDGVEIKKITELNDLINFAESTNNNQ